MPLDPSPIFLVQLVPVPSTKFSFFSFLPPHICASSHLVSHPKTLLYSYPKTLSHSFTLLAVCCFLLQDQPWLVTCIFVRLFSSTLLWHQYMNTLITGESFLCSISATPSFSPSLLSGSVATASIQMQQFQVLLQLLYTWARACSVQMESNSLYSLESLTCLY